MKRGVDADPIDSEIVPGMYKRKRIRVFISLFIGYIGYYIVRSAFKISVPYLIENYHFTKSDTGLIMGVLAVSYGISKLFMGLLSDKCNPRFYISVGLLFSALVNTLFGFTQNIVVMVILMIPMGIFQGMGAPAAQKSLKFWWSKRDRGFYYSTWSTSHNFGAAGAVAASFLAFVLFQETTFLMSSIFVLPSIFSLVLAVIVFCLGQDRPTTFGLPAIDVYKNDPELVNDKEDDNKLSSQQIFVRYILKNKLLIFLAFANACIYAARYGILDWIPTYLWEEKNFSKEEAILFFSLFEMFAIPGTVIMGILSDKLFKGLRAPLPFVASLSLVVPIFVYQTSTNHFIIAAALVVLANCVYIPQMMVGLIAVEVTPNCAGGAASGVTGICGYILGEVIASFFVGQIAEHFGWQASFIVITVASLLAAFFFFLIAVLEVRTRRRQKRHMMKDSDEVAL
jgi:OPA family glycerol-3-phosphate transporter-like MFS transporter